VKPVGAFREIGAGARAEDEPLLRVGHNSHVIHSQPRREYLQMGFKSGETTAVVAAEYRLPAPSGETTAAAAAEDRWRPLKV